MEGERIGLVLAKAVELRFKINRCIHKATTPSKRKTQQGEDAEEQDEEEKQEEESFHVNGDKNPETEEDDEEAERLLNIRDTLESLENQLSSLQGPEVNIIFSQRVNLLAVTRDWLLASHATLASSRDKKIFSRRGGYPSRALQHQQNYEREVALSEIENSRRMLLDKLEEYKGEGLEVIREASEFAGETVKHDNDLLLPPYPSRPLHSLIKDNGRLSHFASMQKSINNRIMIHDPSNKLKENVSDPVLKSKAQSGKGMLHLLGGATKTLLTLVGLVSVFSLSGLRPNFGRRGIPFKISGLFQHPGSENREIIRCPPGKVMLMEDGEARCVVRERIAVPLESMVSKPDVNYGCG